MEVTFQYRLYYSYEKVFKSAEMEQFKSFWIKLSHNAMYRFALMEKFQIFKGQLDIPVSLKSKAHMYVFKCASWDE